MAIGNKAFWSGGYGSDALRTIVAYAFSDLNLRRLYMTPDADNDRALQAFEKAGFQREGLLRAHRLRYGQPVDMVLLGLLRDEYGGPDGS